jgi:hypothetical protein
MQKVLSACGSMVLFFLCRLFFALRAKITYKGFKIRVCVSPIVDYSRSSCHRVIVSSCPHALRRRSRRLRRWLGRRRGWLGRGWLGRCRRRLSSRRSCWRSSCGSRRRRSGDLCCCCSNLWRNSRRRGWFRRRRYGSFCGLSWWCGCWSVGCRRLRRKRWRLNQLQCRRRGISWQRLGNRRVGWRRHRRRHHRHDWLVGWRHHRHSSSLNRQRSWRGGWNRRYGRRGRWSDCRQRRRREQARRRHIQAGTREWSIDDYEQRHQQQPTEKPADHHGHAPATAVVGRLGCGATAWRCNVLTL